MAQPDRKTKYYDENASVRKWLVLFGSFFNHIFAFGIAWGAGVFQVTFMKAFGGPGKAGMIAVIPTLVPAFMSFVGPVSSALTNRFGCRWVTIAGCFLTSAGLILSAIADSVWFLYISYTLIGLGCGIAFIPSVVVVCQYFVNKNRPIAIAIASSGLGVGLFVFPPLIRLLDHAFGWRGALLVLAGLALNMCVAGAVFRPVLTPDVEREDSQKRKIIRVKMLRQAPYLCFILNNIFCLYGMVAYFIHLPGYLVSIGYSEDESAMFVSVAGAATMVSRVLCGLMMQRLDAPISVYALSMSAGAVAVLLTPFLSTSATLFTTSVVFGLGTATIGPLVPLILAELVGSQAIGDGYGYIMVAEGIGSLLGPPISGVLYDWSNNYTASLCVSGAIMILGSAVMLVPLAHIWRKRKMAEMFLVNIAGQNPMEERQVSFSERPLLAHSASSNSASIPVNDSNVLPLPEIELQQMNPQYY